MKLKKLFNLIIFDSITFLFGEVAQLVRAQDLKPGVGGSTAPATNINL